MLAQVRTEAAAQIQIYKRNVDQLVSQENILRNELAHHATCVHALATRISAMQSTWWWRFSMLFRRASHWEDVPQ